MTSPPTPRQIIKALLRGERPQRPLLLPIIFSLGAKLENLSLRDFQSNPTKIAKALLQIRNFVKVDGLACYFDPFLEAEALGCGLNWQAEGSLALTSPPFSGVDELRRKLCTPDEISGRGRIPIARDVVRRLRLMLKDEPALMVGVSGPLALAAQLRGREAGTEDIPIDLVEFAADVTAAVAKTFVEEGANVIFLMEKFPLKISVADRESWVALLEPIINVIRFYEALPVLRIDGPLAACEAINRSGTCVVCPAPDLAGLDGGEGWALDGSDLGLAVPISIFSPDQADRERALALAGKSARDNKFVLLTTAEDISAGTDMKQLSAILDALRSVFSQTPS